MKAGSKRTFEGHGHIAVTPQKQYLRPKIYRAARLANANNDTLINELGFFDGFFHRELIPLKYGIRSPP
ncbi:MAG: hypothetical protein ACREDG_01010 [Methylocella sp.]